MEKHEFPVDIVPFVSFISSAEDTSLRYTYNYVKMFHGEENDGAVCMADGLVPGAYTIVLSGYDHKSKANADSIFDETSKVFISLILTSLNKTKHDIQLLI